VANAVAVTNTSPVIALVSIGHFPLLDALFAKVVVSPVVWSELIDKPGAPEPAQLLALNNIAFYPQQPIPPEAADLDAGERDAISLAVAPRILGTSR
jgi:predicted nucleic acid-binding protein